MGAEGSPSTALLLSPSLGWALPGDRGAALALAGSWGPWLLDLVCSRAGNGKNGIKVLKNVLSERKESPQLPQKGLRYLEPVCWGCSCSQGPSKELAVGLLDAGHILWIREWDPGTRGAPGGFRDWGKEA